MVVGAVRVVHGCHERGVAAINAAAVVHEAPLDGAFVEQPSEFGVHLVSLSARR